MTTKTEVIVRLPDNTPLSPPGCIVLRALWGIVAIWWISKIELVGHFCKKINATHYVLWDLGGTVGMKIIVSVHSTAGCDEYPDNR